MPESMEPYGFQICLAFAEFTSSVAWLVFGARLSSTFLYGLKLFGTTTWLLCSSSSLYFLNPGFQASETSGADDESQKEEYRKEYRSAKSEIREKIVNPHVLT